MLMAVPKYGRVKTNRILNQCRISPSKTIGGFPSASAPNSSRRCATTTHGERFSGRPAGHDPRRGEGRVRDHRTLGRRQGNADRAAARRAGTLELSVSATPREPRAGEVDGRDYHFLTPEEFERRVEAADFLEHATSGNRYGTLREEVERRLAEGRSVVLEIEVQGARQVRAAMPEAVLIFIAPPDPAALRAAGRRGTDSPEAIARRLRTAEIELEAQDAPPRRRERRGRSRPPSWRSSSGASCPYTDGPMSMIRPRVDKLLAHTDTHYAAVLVAAKRARQINAYYHSLSEGAPASTRPDGRGPQRELPHHRPGGDGGGQAEVRVQVLTARRADGPDPARGEWRHRRLQGA